MIQRLEAKSVQKRLTDQMPLDLEEAHEQLIKRI